jgi:hypothetical protein
MDQDSYSLSDSYVSVGGGPVPQVLDDWARNLVGVHYLIASAVIIVLSVLVIWLLVNKFRENFNPTATLRFQKRDGLGWSEHLEPDRSKSVFAQEVQSGGGGAFNVDPAAGANAPGSLGWQVLHSSDFNCDSRVPVGADAWTWMSNVAHEEMTDKKKPKNDNDFSKVLSGY